MEVTVRGVPIYYEAYGAGLPVICIHGYYADHRLMTGSMEPVFKGTTGFQRLYPDLPGMGKTPFPHWIQNIHDILDLLLEWIDVVLPDVPFLLCGESYGGYLSLGILHERPSQVRGMFLFCPCVVADASQRDLPKPVTIFREKEVPYQENPHYFPKYESMVAHISKRTWRRYQEEILPGILSCKPNMEMLVSLRTGRGRFSFEKELFEMPFDYPATILTGRQDSVVGYMDAMRLMNTFTRCTFSVVDGTGHYLQIEQPDLFAAFLQDYLQRAALSTNWGAAIE